ncbi:MAG: hypothetical protein JNL18_18045 [Planctomycetaceae bacterium]|nr:hypothetical protein [Planctomycetaceae bacterium]
MDIRWIVTEDDVARLHAFQATQENNPFVRRRIKDNLRADKKPVTRERFWKVHVGCLLTTQQRSGPNSSVSHFMASPWRLTFAACSAADDAEAFCLKALKQFGGIRRSSVVSREVAANLAFVQGEGWKKIRKCLESVRLGNDAGTERQAAEFLADSLRGIGPKQSRNLLQWLGLSKFEVPIDSRITHWLNNFGFPLKLSANALSDRNYYDFVSEGFQQLSLAAGLSPCVLDAMIFSSYDGDA